MTDDMPAACACWLHGSALGHEGHCCFLVDDRDAIARSDAWRADEDVCHVPETPGAGEHA